MSSSRAGEPVHAIPERASGRRGKHLGGKERWLSALGGGALFLYGLSRRGVSGIALATAGATLIARGATGRSGLHRSSRRDAVHQVPLRAGGRPAVAMAGPDALRIQRSITIGKSPEDVYRLFRDFEMLPRLLPEIDWVKAKGPSVYSFRGRGVLGSVMEGDMEIIEDIPGERILLRSTEPRRLRCGAGIYFSPAPGGRGTEVTVVLDSDASGGVLAKVAAFLEGGGPAMKLRGALRRAKQLMEAGEIPTIIGQPSGREGE